METFVCYAADFCTNEKLAMVNEVLLIFVGQGSFNILQEGICLFHCYPTVDTAKDYMPLSNLKKNKRNIRVGYDNQLKR